MSLHKAHWIDRKWLWHMEWIKALHKGWVQQSKLVWLALLSAEHLQGAGRHLSTPCIPQGQTGMVSSYMVHL